MNGCCCWADGWSWKADGDAAAMLLAGPAASDPAKSGVMGLDPAASRNAKDIRDDDDAAAGSAEEPDAPSSSPGCAG